MPAPTVVRVSWYVPPRLDLPLTDVEQKWGRLPNNLSDERPRYRGRTRDVFSLIALSFIPRVKATRAVYSALDFEPLPYQTFQETNERRDARPTSWKGTRISHLVDATKRAAPGSHRSGKWRFLKRYDRPFVRMLYICSIIHCLGTVLPRLRAQ